jgi:hypothetical protein
LIFYCAYSKNIYVFCTRRAIAHAPEIAIEKADKEIFAQRYNDHAKEHGTKPWLYYQT